MLRSKRRNKGVVKSFNYRDLVHYSRYQNTIVSMLDDTKTEILGSNIVDNLVDMPDVSLSDKKSIKCLGFGMGGATFIAINNRWRLMFGNATLKTDYVPVVLPAPKNSKQILRQFTIPRIANKSVMQPGDMLRLTLESFKTGSVNLHTRSFFFGNTGILASDIEIDVATTPLSTTNNLTEIIEFYRMDDSSGSSVIMKNLSKGGYNVGLGGTQGATVVPGETITIPNMDTNDTVMTFSAVLDGTSDTFTNNNWNVELITCGP